MYKWVSATACLDKKNVLACAPFPQVMRHLRSLADEISLQGRTLPMCRSARSTNRTCETMAQCATWCNASLKVPSPGSAIRQVQISGFALLRAIPRMTTLRASIIESIAETCSAFICEQPVAKGAV